jgi:hypothetical protein
LVCIPLDEFDRKEAAASGAKFIGTVATIDAALDRSRNQNARVLKERAVAPAGSPAGQQFRLDAI